MKKVLSLLLVLALMTSLVFALGIPDINDGTRRLDDADIPADAIECDPAVAGVRLDLADGRTYYFEELDNMNYVWGTYQNCDRTFTLLKDHDIYVPLKPQEEWRNVPMTTIDLNGYTITNYAERCLFDNRFDAHLTVKNGIIIDNGGDAESYHGMACAGSWASCVVSDRYGYPATMEFHLENMIVLMTNSKGILYKDYQYRTTMTIKNSTVWCAGSGIIGQKSDTAAHATNKFKLWPKDAAHEGKIVIENSTVGCEVGPVILSDGAHEITVTNSTLVSKDGTSYECADGKFLPVAEGVKADFTAEVNGTAVSGIGMTYGSAPTAPVLPEHVVEEPEAPAETPEAPAETPEAPAETPEAPAEEKGAPVGIIVAIAAVVVIAVVAVVVLKKKKK